MSGNGILFPDRDEMGLLDLGLIQLAWSSNKRGRRSRLSEKPPEKAPPWIEYVLLHAKFDKIHSIIFMIALNNIKQGRYVIT